MVRMLIGKSDVVYILSNYAIYFSYILGSVCAEQRRDVLAKVSVLEHSSLFCNI